MANPLATYKKPTVFHCFTWIFSFFSLFSHSKRLYSRRTLIPPTRLASRTLCQTMKSCLLWKIPHVRVPVKLLFGYLECLLTRVFCLAALLLEIKLRTKKKSGFLDVWSNQGLPKLEAFSYDRHTKQLLARTAKKGCLRPGEMWLSKMASPLKRFKWKGMTDSDWL